MSHKYSTDQTWSNPILDSGRGQLHTKDIDSSVTLGMDGGSFNDISPIMIPTGNHTNESITHLYGVNSLDHEAQSFGSWDETFSWPRTAFSLPEEQFSWPTSTTDGSPWQNESSSSYLNRICSMPEYSAMESFDTVPSITRSQLADLNYDPSYDPTHKTDSLFSIGSLDSTLENLDLDTTFGSFDSNGGSKYATLATLPRAPDSSGTSRLRPARKTRGRKGPLAPKSREDASRMRGLGACQTCKRRKAKCDDGVYCRACIGYLGDALLVQPAACRGRALEQLTDALLAGQVFPRRRPPAQFLGQDFTIDSQLGTVGLILGFGPPLHVEIKLVRPSETRKLIHDHVEYPWQITNPSLCSVGDKTVVRHAMFPAILAHDTSVQFRAQIDEHLGTLLEKKNFCHFPLYRSDLMLLREIYRLYEALTVEDSRLLHEALKLLIAVHVGGDISIDKDCHCSSRQFARVFHPCELTGQPDQPSSPCLIRSQLGPVLRCLAKNYMRSVLQQLGRLSLSGADGKSAVVSATYIVLLMALESIQFHTAKENYHAIFDKRAVDFFQHPQTSSPFDFSDPLSTEYAVNNENPHGVPSVAPLDDTNSKRDIAIDRLLDFYSACLGSGSNSARNPPTRSRSSSNAKPYNTPAAEACETFLNRSALALTNAEQYLASKRDAADGDSSKNVGFFFDRLLARFSVL